MTKARKRRKRTRLHQDVRLHRRKRPVRHGHLLRFIAQRLRDAADELERLDAELDDEW
jgi:hypothetical protein